MGLFDRFKKSVEENKENVTQEKENENNDVLLSFYNDCVADYHKTAQGKGFANKGIIFIPELIPIGEKTVLAFLKDRFFQMQFGGNPHMYYYVIMSLSLQAGMVFAEKWHSNYDKLKSGFVDQVIKDGPADLCKPLLKQLGLSNIEKENAFYQAIFDRWLKMHEPYWELKNPREYTFKATLAAYQLGISTILEKFGY